MTTTNNLPTEQGDRVQRDALTALVWVQIVFLYVAPAVAHPTPDAPFLELLLLSAGLFTMLGRTAPARLLFGDTNPFFLAFLCLVPISFLWSMSPPDTLSRFRSMMSIVSIAAAFCLVGWHPRRLQNELRPLLTQLLAGSVVLYLLSPRIALELVSAFGTLASFGAIIWLHALLTGEVKLKSALAGFIFAVSCVYLSHSATGLLSTIVACAVLLVLLRSPGSLLRYMPYAVGSLLMLVLLYAIIILRPVPVLDALVASVTSLTGQDPNRSEIWRIVEAHVRLSPFLGSGYGAYWVKPPSQSSAVLTYPVESHNGYLEITNDLGMVGLACLLGYLVLFVRGSLQLMGSDRPQAALYLALIFQQLVMNLDESDWLQVNSGAIFAIMTLATMALARGLQDRPAAAA
jgi:O-antigen ligase